MTEHICANCCWWNFKVSAEKSFGECLNPKVGDNIHISWSLVHEIYELPEEVRTAIKQYARVYFEEDNFGCIHFEEKTV